MDDEIGVGREGFSREHTLEDGTRITVRPIQPDDRDELQRAYRATSAETKYLRFLGVVGELSPKTLAYLTDVDQENHVALVATMTSPDLKTERGVGVARFIRLASDPSVAEAAITVADDMQRRGIGTLLARELERAARERGVRVIRADVLAGNRTMRSILEGARARRVPHSETPDVVSYDIALEPEADADDDVASALMRILRGAAETMAVQIRRLGPAPSSTMSAAAAARSDEAEPGEGET